MFFGPPQDGPNPGQKLPQDNGLGNKIIRPQFEPDNAVDRISGPGQENDRHIGKLLHSFGDRKTIVAGHVQIEKYEVEALVFGHDFFKFGPIAGL